jgi:hypothetical protein
MANTYLVKLGDKLRVLPSKDFDEMNHSEVMMLALASFDEQKKQLLEDAVKGKSKVYYGRNVVDALEKSISKFEEKIPNIRECLIRLAYGKIELN